MPVLTAVPEKCLGAWTEFTGDRGTTLFCARYVIDGWWQEMSSRMARMRNDMHFAPDRAAATLRSSHPTT